MAYTPNPDREVVNGKAKVSAKELADFQKQYGNDKTLRDLLNADKGLVRRKDSGEGSKNAEDIQSSTDALPSMSRQSGPPKPSFVEGVKAADQSSWDSGKSSTQTDSDSVWEKAKRGDSPLNDALMGAGQFAIAAYPIGKALRVARPVVGAAIKKVFDEDGPFPTFNRAEDPRPSTFDTLSPENQAVSQSYRNSYDDRPGPMKKGGQVKKYAKGGRINLDACGVSTHTPSKKNANW
jgi:hypothetical protein